MSVPDVAVHPVIHCQNAVCARCLFLPCQLTARMLSAPAVCFCPVIWLPECRLRPLSASALSSDCQNAVCARCLFLPCHLTARMPSAPAVCIRPVIWLPECRLRPLSVSALSSDCQNAVCARCLHPPCHLTARMLSAPAVCFCPVIWLPECRLRPLSVSALSADCQNAVCARCLHPPCQPTSVSPSCCFIDINALGYFFYLRYLYVHLPFCLLHFLISVIYRNPCPLPCCYVIAWNEKKILNLININ